MLEYCALCNAETDKAGIGDDSLTHDGVNALCEECFDWEALGEQADQELKNAEIELKAWATGRKSWCDQVGGNATGDWIGAYERTGRADAAQIAYQIEVVKALRLLSESR